MAEPAYTDGPLTEIEKECQAHLEAGDTFYQKFTCDACGERVTMSDPNVLYTQGRHDECPVQDGHITDLRVKGCNYMVIKRQPKIYDGETQKGRFN